MKTQKFTAMQLKAAAQLLRQGQLVAFPTETVFGLGAIATDERAVSQVFLTKGRPKDNPLIVHVSRPEQVLDYVETVSNTAQRLMQLFWPGPLTIIFPQKQGTLAPSVTPGKTTVAMRMPDSVETRALIDEVGIPLVGPSANKSGKPSPTRVEHVLNDFTGEISGVVVPQTPLLAVGVESTVVYPIDDVVHILRPGAITKEILSEVGFKVIEKTASEQLNDTTLISPGVKYTHYSPKQPVHVWIGEVGQALLAVLKQYKMPIAMLADEAILSAAANVPNVVATYSYGKQGDLKSATQQLYAGLRALEQSDAQVIIAQGFNDEANSHALMNRLLKASDKVINEQQYNLR